MKTMKEENEKTIQINNEFLEDLKEIREEVKNEMIKIREDFKLREEKGKEIRGNVEASIEEFKNYKEKESQLTVEQRKNYERNIAADLSKALEFVRQGLEPEYISKTKEGALFLKEIALIKKEYTSDVILSIFYYFGDFLIGNKPIIKPTGELNKEFITSYLELKTANSNAADIIERVLKQLVEEEKINTSAAEELQEILHLFRKDDFKKNIPPELVANLPLDRPEILEITTAILSPDNFLEYVKKRRQHLIEEKKVNLGRELRDDDLIEIDKELSHEVEQAITDLVSELYNKADADPSYRRMSFHEVESIGYLQSLQTAYNTISTQIQLIGRVLSERKDLKGIRFFARFSEKKEIAQDMDGKEVINTFLDPLKKPKEISLTQYFSILNLEIAHIRELREFTHNANIVLRFPQGGEQSPWAQLSGYANKIMTTSDFDTIAFLPHSEVYQDALNIYTNLLQAELAKTDWILDPKLFVAGDDGLNDLERETLRILNLMYKGKKNEYQIRAAFSLAQGVAMAILLTEPETIANADPNLKKKLVDGQVVVNPTYLGEWLSDTVATNVLNPFIRAHLRWLSEGTVGGPIGFLPIPDPKLVKSWKIGIWDHDEVIKDIEGFHRRFFEGKRGNIKGGHLTLFDIRNPGRIGSFATRGGWRWEESYQGLLYIEENGELKKADFLTQWRRLENVGFEPWLHFFTSNKDVFFQEINKKDDGKNISFKRYIYTKYFSNIYSEEEFNKIIEKKSEDFFYELPIRFLLNRLPSKIITEERTRFSEEGERIWEILKNKCGFDFSQMDLAVKDLIIAQTNLRQTLSQLMRKNEEEGQDIGLIGDNLFLNSNTVETYLRKSGITDEVRIENVKKLLSVFNDFFNPKNEEGKKKYLSWIKKIKGGRSTIPYALAPEETDYRYLTLKSSGVTTIKRVLGDMASIDRVLTPSFGKFLKLLKSTAISSKKDVSELVKFITEIKTTLEGLHGKDYANEIACYFGYLTIAYFKKDTFAKPLGGLAGLGQKTSIAAEFAGASGRVWEWDSREIGRFIFALEQSGALEKEPYLLQKTPEYEGIELNFLKFKKKLPTEINLSQWLGEKLGRKDNEGKVVPIKFFGREIKIKLPKVRKKDFNIYSDTLKKMAGGEFIHKLWDGLNTIIPLALAIILFTLIQKAFKEAFQQKK